MIKKIMNSFKKSLEKSDWMDDLTKGEAIKKL